MCPAAASPFRSAKSANQMDSRGRLSLQLSYHTSPRQTFVSLPRAEQSIKSGSISPSPLHSPLFTFGEARSGNASAFLCFFREQQAAPLPNVTAPLHSSLFTIHYSPSPLGKGDRRRRRWWMRCSCSLFARQTKWTVEDACPYNYRITLRLGNRVGRKQSTSHTTVRAVRHTAVQFKLNMCYL